MAEGQGSPPISYGRGHPVHARSREDRRDPSPAAGDRRPGSTSTRAAAARCRPRSRGRWTSRPRRSSRSAGPRSTSSWRSWTAWREARATIAAVLVADPDDIALTHSTTDGINLVLSSLPWRAGRPGHHHEPRAPGRARAAPGAPRPARRRGRGRRRRRRRGRRADARRRSGLPSSGRRRAVVFSHVLWTTGAVLPVGRIGTLARDAGAVSIIDGAQAAGAIPVLLEDLDVDAYAVPGQKWLLGPEGMGALWVRRAFADAVVPATAGYLGYAKFTPGEGGRSTRVPAGSRRPGSTGPSVIGLARSVRLAVDVRRAAVGARSGRAASRPARGASPGDRRGDDGHARRPTPAPSSRSGSTGWSSGRGGRRARGRGRSRSCATSRPSTRCASPSGSGTPRRSWSACAASSCSPRTRPRPSRRAGRSPCWGAMASPSPEPARPARARGPPARLRRGPLAPVPARARARSFRAVASSLSVAASSSAGCTSPTTSRSSAARDLPGGDLRLAFLVAYVVHRAARRGGGDLAGGAAAHRISGAVRRRERLEPRARAVRGRPDRVPRARGAPRAGPAVARRDVVTVLRRAAIMRRSLDQTDDRGRA